MRATYRFFWFGDGFGRPRGHAGRAHWRSATAAEAPGIAPGPSTSGSS